MMNDNGWIKLHRKIWDNPIVTKDADHLAVWIYLLTHANHKDKYALFGTKKITVGPGQLITGRLKIAENTGVEESKVKRILELFKSDQQIDQQTNSRGSLITILRWNEYQKVDQQNDQQMTNKRPTNDQQMTTNKKERKKERKKKEDESEWLSDRLSSTDWKKLRARYEDHIGLVDMVDTIVDSCSVEKPLQYIIKVAEERGWPHKGGIA